MKTLIYITIAYIVISIMLNQIGTLNETTLHKDLKWLYSESNDQIERKVGKYIVDIVRDDLLIEIQTTNFSKIRNKLGILLENYKVKLVHPIIQDNWIINLDTQLNKNIRRRLSPVHCSYIDIFEELVRIPKMISHPNFTIEIILVQIEEIREKSDRESWRRKSWRIYDKKLLKVIESKKFNNPIDFLYFIPKNIDIPFTNNELAKLIKRPLSLAQKLSYCLRKMEVLKTIGKNGNTLIFDFNNDKM
ncbi:MAG: hypothetical protein ACFFA4_11390 [Promethearchaeota archaeon]